MRTDLDRADATGSDVRTLDGLVYDQPLGFRPLRLDLYLPPQREGVAPLIVFAHGGGWMRGHRGVFLPATANWRPNAFQRLASFGFAVASVEYRLSGEARFPAQLDDLAAAVQWLAEHASAYGFDSGRTVLWGSSAGAHLLALLALAPGTTGIAGVIDWYGPTDLPALAVGAAADDSDSREARLLGAPVGSLPELARAASPVNHVHAGAPPFLIAHGTADRLVPFPQSAALAAALTEAGVEVRFDAIEGASHMWEGMDDLEPVFRAAVDFAREVTGRGPAEPAGRR